MKTYIKYMIAGTLVASHCYATPIELDYRPFAVEDQMTLMKADIEGDQENANMTNDVATSINSLRIATLENKIAILDMANNLGEITRSVSRIADAIEAIGWYFSLAKASYEAANPPVTPEP